MIGAGSKSGLLDALFAGRPSRPCGEAAVNSLSKQGQIATYPAADLIG